MNKTPLKNMMTVPRLLFISLILSVNFFNNSNASCIDLYRAKAQKREKVKKNSEKLIIFLGLAAAGQVSMDTNPRLVLIPTAAYLSLPIYEEVIGKKWRESNTYQKVLTTLELAQKYKPTPYLNKELSVTLAKKFNYQSSYLKSTAFSYLVADTINHIIDNEVLCARKNILGRTKLYNYTSFKALVLKEVLKTL